jgi:ABC-type Mn2+/Zn2+ transport system permease subunit
MNTLREILSFDFLLRNSLYDLLLVGVLGPLVGIFLILRRMVFLGVALPQISSAGIAFAFMLPALGLAGHTHAGHFEGDEHFFAFAGSLSFTLLALLVLAWLERRGSGMAEGRLGGAYVLAGAFSILLLAKNPIGEQSMLDLLRGEIIAVSHAQLILTAVTLGVVVLTLLIFRREFLLASFDRDLAITLRKKLLVWDLLLYFLVGTTISMCVLCVGPLVTFGFLLLPALAAHAVARNLRQFAVLASTFGGITAFFGFYVSYRWDLPVGPTCVALLGLVWGLAVFARRLVARA